MRALAVVMYLALGCLQAFAIFAGLINWLELDWLPALLIAPVAAYTPVVGTAAAFFGAVHGWDLDMMQAAVVFIGPFVFIAVLYAAAATAARPDPLNGGRVSGGRRRRRSPEPASRAAVGRPAPTR